MKWPLLLLLSAYISAGQTDVANQLEKAISVYNKPDAPGMCVTIVKNGETIFTQGFGLAAIDETAIITPNTVFNVGSVAKQFTASCIWILVRDNKISLGDDIRKYLPEMPVAEPPVLIQNLLDHSSGIRNYHTLMDLQGFDYETEYYNNESVLHLASRQKPATAKHRRKTSYSNTNYNLLALIVERVSRQNLNDFAKKHLFFPLQMKSTAYRISNKQKFANRAYRHVQDNNKFLQLADYVQESYGAGNLWTSSQDMAKWMTMLAGHIPGYEPLRKFLFTTNPSGNPEQKYARGVLLDTYKGHRTVGHSGSEVGMNAYLVTVPDSRLGISVLCNSEIYNPTAIANSLLDILLDDPTPNKPSEIPDDIKIEPAPFTGHYREINSDMEMKIYFENDTLRSRGSNAKKGVALLTAGTGRFQRKRNPGVRYDFSKSEDWDLVISFSGNPFYFKKLEADRPVIDDFKELEGDYFSEELQTAYRFFVSDGMLNLSFKNNPKVALIPLGNDEFGNGRRTLFSFRRNSDNKIERMLVSAEGSVSEILFLKH